MGVWWTRWCHSSVLSPCFRHLRLIGPPGQMQQVPRCLACVCYGVGVIGADRFFHYVLSRRHDAW